jgi:glycosyltransferase involved in cell wall biosynthesis
VAAVGLDDRVRFLGLRDDVPDLLPGFDVFALSSRYEGLPIALLEAMAAGRACVATSVGGVPEVVTHGQDGLLVPAGDAAALAVALGKVLEDADLRAALGSSAATTGAGYDIAPSVARTLEVYAEVTR